MCARSMQGYTRSSQTRTIGVEENIYRSNRYDVRGLVSGYSTAMPFSLAACWKNPFSAPLSPVQVRPARYIKRGTRCRGLVVA